MYVYTYMYLYMCMYIYIYIYMYTFIYIYTYIYSYVYINLYCAGRDACVQSGKRMAADIWPRLRGRFSQKSAEYYIYHMKSP